MKAGIVREVTDGERRVAGTPATVERLLAMGFEQVLVETGAGLGSGIADHAYASAGATIAYRDDLFDEADVLLKVAPPTADEVARLRRGQTLVGFVWPARNKALIGSLAERGVTTFGIDQVPRISRAQKLDALSSMANLAGYRAVIEAAHAFGRPFTGQVTAAGKIAPARVLVIGAGVAGLAAIGAARALGAIVRAFDTRPEVAEQVESMGAQFLALEGFELEAGSGGYAKLMTPEFIAAEMALFAAQAREVDIIVTTALVPGHKAPTLIDAAMVESMRPGSVIVDMAAEQGGNCALTRPGELYETPNGVRIIGYTDLAGRMGAQASELYGNNLCHLLAELGWPQNGGSLDLDNEVVRGALVTHDSAVTWPPPKVPEPSPEPARKKSAIVAHAAAAPTPEQQAEQARARARRSAWVLALSGLALLLVGLGAPPTFLAHLTVFVLACFVGWQVIWNVAPALHTPLMAVTNAISGIIILAGMLQVTGRPTSAATILGAIAILIATINISGGFLVTQRMLRMFRR